MLVQIKHNMFRYSYSILSLGKAGKTSGPKKELVCAQNHDM